MFIILLLCTLSSYNPSPAGERAEVQLIRPPAFLQPPDMVTNFLGLLDKLHVYVQTHVAVHGHPHNSGSWAGCHFICHPAHLALQRELHKLPVIALY